MKITLVVAGPTLEEIKNALKTLVEEDNWVSNTCGDIGKAVFDYSFTGSNDVYEDDDKFPVINPNKK